MSYFTKAFRQFYGVTPTAYRIKKRKKDGEATPS